VHKMVGQDGGRDEGTHGDKGVAFEMRESAEHMARGAAVTVLIHALVRYLKLLPKSKLGFHLCAPAS
jgi:hypothetical protein